MSEIIAVFVAMFLSITFLPKMAATQKTNNENLRAVATAKQLQQISDATQLYVTSQLSTLTATATATTPVIIPISTIVSAGMLPAGFNSVNPYGQTWQLQVLQPSAGNLQALVVATGGQTLTDTQASNIAAISGSSGGFIAQNDSTIYPGGTGVGYGSYGGWNISTTNYSGLTVGHPVALVSVNANQVGNNYLYRNAVPGQPQVNQMNTAIDMNSNNINNAGSVNATSVSVAAGNNIKVGNSVVYGDSINTALRQSGAVYFQNPSATGPADLAEVGNINSYGNISANGAIYSNSTISANGTINSNSNIAAQGAVTGWNVSASNQVWAGGNIIATGLVAGNGIASSNYISAAGTVFTGPAAISGAASGLTVATPGNTAFVQPGGAPGNIYANDVYLQNIGQWASQVGTPPGTVCGMMTNAGSAGSMCQGFNPWYNCPPGYAQIAWIVNFGDNTFRWCSKL